MVRIVDQAKRARAWHSTIEEALQGVIKATDTNQEKAWDVSEAALAFKQNIELLKGQFKDLLTTAVERYVTDIKASPSSVFDEIEKIFEGKVGPAPKSTGELSNLTKDAEERYRLGIPPGYADQAKEESTHAYRTVAGLTYKKSLSDLVIWRQILAHARAKKIELVVFVTDDVKEDWSLNKGEARRELREEALEHGISMFQTTTLASFFTGLQHFRQVVVANETVEVAREVGRDRTDIEDVADGVRYESARQSVVNWLKGGAAGVAHSDTSYMRWAYANNPAVLFDILPFAYIPEYGHLFDAAHERMQHASNYDEASHVELVVSVSVNVFDHKVIRFLSSALKAMSQVDGFPWDTSAVRRVRLGVSIEGKFKTIGSVTKSTYREDFNFSETEFESWKSAFDLSKP